jgi:hypothetical protein
MHIEFVEKVFKRVCKRVVVCISSIAWQLNRG